MGRDEFVVEPNELVLKTWMLAMTNECLKLIPQFQHLNNMVQVGLVIEAREQHDDRLVADAAIRPLVEHTPESLPTRCYQNGSVTTGFRH